MNIQEKAREIFEIGAEPVVGMAASLLFEGAVGAVAPGVMSVVMNYRQVRSDRNIERFMRDVKARMADIDARLETLDTDGKKRVKDICLPIAFDYAADSKQEEKIQCLVNGFVNAAMDAAMGEDLQLMYYDTLDRLSLLELRVLRLHGTVAYLDDEDTDNFFKIMQDHGIDQSQYTMIRQKLSDNGLLEKISRNDASADKAIEGMQKVLEEMTKPRNPKVIQYKSIRIPKMDRLSYKITPLGRNFLKFFLEIN